MSTTKITNTGRVMVIVAHPDDEVLGCGATALHNRHHDGRLSSLVKIQYTPVVRFQCAPTLNGIERTGYPLFWLDEGTNTGDIIGQLAGLLDPRVANSTQLYEGAIQLGVDLLKMFVPHINSGRVPSIPQDLSKRTVYKKVEWKDWPKSLVRRARVYPYV